MTDLKNRTDLDTLAYLHEVEGDGITLRITTERDTGEMTLSMENTHGPLRQFCMRPGNGDTMLVAGALIVATTIHLMEANEDADFDDALFSCLWKAQSEALRILDGAERDGLARMLLSDGTELEFDVADGPAE